MFRDFCVQVESRVATAPQNQALGMCKVALMLYDAKVCLLTESESYQCISDVDKCARVSAVERLALNW